MSTVLKPTLPPEEAALVRDMINALKARREFSTTRTLLSAVPITAPATALITVIIKAQ
jgi:hypothetical protein